MRLSVAGNWDFQLLDGLATIPEVTSVYAKLPFDLVGGGRAGEVLPAVTWETAIAYIRAARERGLSFCYLLNAPCLGNLEQSRVGRQRLLDFVGQLVEAGVDSVSISNLALVSIVKRNFPSLAIRGSVLSWPTNLPRLQHHASLGIDPLILPYSEFNRDFDALARVRAAIPTGIVLFANIACIYHCSYLAEHAASVGHASQEGGRSPDRPQVIDSYLWKCTRRRLLEPHHLLMSRWIRPEDLSVYEALGFEEFKIIDRSRSTAWLLRAARAYADRRYEGNLLDIVSLEMFGDPSGFHGSIGAQTSKRLPLVAHEERRLAIHMLRLRQRVLSLNVRIDNAKLAGFLEGFRGIDCMATVCERCRYCHRYAERAVQYDRAAAEAIAKEIEELTAEFESAKW